ncbi:TPA: DUF4157 domain-containing protein [Methanosarcinaceae archaeon]|nr:DUF4157 domain-containing protein [Methanosarcinaceae archaeon]
MNQSKKLTPSHQSRTKPANRIHESNPVAIIQRARINPKSLTQTDVLQLQRTIGNRAVGRLLSGTGGLPFTAQQATVQRQEIPEEEELLQGKMMNTVQRQEIPEEEEPLQGKFAGTGTSIQCKEDAPRPNKTGLPDNLKAGIETISGLSQDDVQVHYNSGKPAQVRALAYTRGADIHVAPGQEQHLPHEAWHVVQQKQGRVQPTMQLKGGVPVNDDAGLEREADVMGRKAAAVSLPTTLSGSKTEMAGPHGRSSQGMPVQRYTELENDIKLSTNSRFAVQNEGRDGKLFVANGVNLPDLQHVELEVGGEEQINGSQMRKVTADFENEEAMNEMYCGKFSRSVTGIVEDRENENAPVGRSLYTENVTGPQISRGWKNHYAPVIVADAGDRGTLETAVGIPYCWFGIYGSARGQTFRFKTQYANILRNITNGWVDEETGRRILTELDKYKNNTIENDESLHAYTLNEVLKLREMAQAEPVALTHKEPVETETPLTKQQSDNEIRRKMREQERRDRNRKILAGVLALGATGLSILAWYYYKAFKSDQ